MYQICICTSWHFSSTDFQTMVLRLILWKKEKRKEERRKRGREGGRGVGRAEGGGGLEEGKKEGREGEKLPLWHISTLAACDTCVSVLSSSAAFVSRYVWVQRGWSMKGRQDLWNGEGALVSWSIRHDLCSYFMEWIETGPTPGLSILHLCIALCISVFSLVTPGLRFCPFLPLSCSIRQRIPELVAQQWSDHSRSCLPLKETP